MNTVTLRVIAFAGMIVTVAAATARAASCVPPPGFVDTPHPALSADAPLVSHTEEMSFDRPLKVVVASTNRPLKDTVQRTSALPGVAGDYALTPGDFGAPGTRRLVCLTDGSTLEEQSLEREQTDTAYHFRYVVWNYTTAKARPIEYGLGDFKYTSDGADRSHVVWVYSFKLRDNRFPGYLGAMGRYLFRVGFLDRDYAELMRASLGQMKTAADNEAAISSK